MRGLTMIILRRFAAPALLLFALFLPPAIAQTGPGGVKTFATPEEAVAALVTAARAKDAKAFADIFGPALRDWIVSGDPVDDAQALEDFITAYDKKHEIEKQGDKATLSVGEDSFPFPFPIVKTGERWAFDAEQGKEELLNRRIGENELSTIEVMLAIVDAQRDYSVLARQIVGTGLYAQRFISTPGKKDGLYWPSKEGEPQSPLGPLVASATSQGYRVSADTPAPYYGYYFRMLTAQGAAARGGAYDYIVNGKMIGGFAALAYPARYGISGFKTFMVNHDGDVYEADLGPNTTAIATGIRAFNPDQQWKKVSPP